MTLSSLRSVPLIIAFIYQQRSWGRNLAYEYHWSVCFSYYMFLLSQLFLFWICLSCGLSTFFNILLSLCYALKTFIPWGCGKIANHNWEIYFLVYFRWLKDWHSLAVPSWVFPSGKYHFLKIPESDCLCHVGHYFLLPGQNGFRAMPTLRKSWK